MSHTAKQQEAIESWGRTSICVTAGPGSGKTRVLTERIRWLSREKRVEPGHILAITFTRKAAASMYRRLVEGAGHDLEWRRAIERAQISTIDAFCARVLREHALEAGVDPDFRILEPAEAEFELRRVVNETLDAVLAEDRAAAVRFLLSFKATNEVVDEALYTKVHQEFAGLVNAVRTAGVTPFAAVQRQGDGAAYNEQRSWAVGVATRILSAYDDWKNANACLDFADLVARVNELLAAGLELHFRFRHILVDENQDTNPLQDKLLDRLQAANPGSSLLAVGDINQSIYAFRNAKPAVFRNFRASVEAGGGHAVDLLENFRSRPEILLAAEALTRKAPGVEERALSAASGFPDKAVPSVEVIIARGKESDAAKRREADWVARRIAELRDELPVSDRPHAEGEPRRPRKARWKDFAVLVRTNALLDDFAEGLRRAGIPYQLNAGRGFFDSEEVRDLLAFLRTIDNPRDEVSLAAAMRSPFGGVDDATLLALKPDKRNLAVALHRPPALPRAQSERVERFRSLLGRFRRERDETPIDTLIQRILQASGYEAMLLEQHGGAQRSANLSKLTRIAGRLDTGDLPYQQVIAKLEEFRLLSPGEAEATVPEDAADAVHLMTIHMAKGLEFPVVVIPAMQSPGRSGSDSFLFDADLGLGVRWLKDGESVEDDVYAKIHAARKQGEAEEDNRVLYVALTRAEEHVVLSADWGPKVIRWGWSKRLESGLDIDLKRIDETPSVVAKKGVAYRLYRTDQDPPPVKAEAAVDRASLPRVQPLPPGAQADHEVSATAVSLFAECPRKYYLSRYLGLEPAAPPRRVSEPDDESDRDVKDATEIGRNVHQVLAGLSPREQASEEELRLVETFESSPLGALAASSPCRRELDLVFPVGRRLVRGVLDLLIEDAAGGVLVDYKTDRANDVEIDAKAAQYGVQLQLYALALESQGRKPVRAALHFLRPDRVVDVDLSPTALQAAADLAERVFQAQQTQTFALNPGKRCHSCSHFRGLCPAEPPGSQGGARGQLLLGF